MFGDEASPNPGLQKRGTVHGDLSAKSCGGKQPNRHFLSLFLAQCTAVFAQNLNQAKVKHA